MYKVFLEGAGGEVNEGNYHGLFRGRQDVIHAVLTFLKIFRSLLLNTNLAGGCLVFYLFFHIFFYILFFSTILHCSGFEVVRYILEFGLGFFLVEYMGFTR